MSYWDKLRTSFWFLPSMMATMAIILSVVLIELDNLLSLEMLENVGWLYQFGPEGARAILSAIASSMITVAGLTFSITMLTLQLASSQFGPRLLRNFMADRGNQVVLGTFISTFLYCLLVLRTVRGIEGSSFVPHVSVAFGVLLAIASIAVLIYFIHHVATTIRIESLLESLAHETRETIERLYPDRLGADQSDVDGRGNEDGGKEAGADQCTVLARASGYVQHIDVDALMEIATTNDLLVKIDARPGSFLMEAHPVFSVRSSTGVSDEALSALRGTFVLGKERTPEQDLEFSIRRIVEIAQRALSPGINDPTTALYCIDRLGEAFDRLGKRKMPSAKRYDEERQLRVVAETLSFDDLVCPAYAAIARYGMADVEVMSHLLETMSRTARSVQADQCSRLMALGRSLTREVRDKMPLEFERYVALKQGEWPEVNGVA